MYSKTVIIGHLGRDPLLQVFPDSGTPVCNFDVAVDRVITGTGKIKTTETDWYHISTYGKLAEQCEQGLGKGSLVLVEGDNLHLDRYTNREGQPAANLAMTGKTVKFLSKREAAKIVRAPAYDDSWGDDEVPDF